MKNGVILIKDLNSTSGTFVGPVARPYDLTQSHKMDPCNVYAVTSDHYFRINSTLFVFRPETSYAAARNAIQARSESETNLIETNNNKNKINNKNNNDKNKDKKTNNSNSDDSKSNDNRKRVKVKENLKENNLTNLIGNNE